MTEDVAATRLPSVRDAGVGRPVSWAGRLVALVGGLAVGPGRVAAHAGTSHAGTPHWVLFALVLAGLGTVAGRIVGTTSDRVGACRTPNVERSTAGEP